MFNSKAGYDPELSISVLCMQSEYMHFSVEVAEKYRDNPQKRGFESIKKAMKNIKGNEYLDSYIQFTRTKKEKYEDIVRTPPYFILTFIRGLTINKEGKTISGNESEFLSGILEYTGPNIPMFGGSASSSLEEYEKGRATNYQFANGKLYLEAAVVIFVVTDIYFATIVNHGYVLTSDYAAVTKLDKNGYEILSLNGKDPISEYCRILGVDKKDYLRDSYKNSFSRPFGLVLEDGNSVVREAVPNPDKKSLHSNFRLHKNILLNVLSFDKKKTLETMRRSMENLTTLESDKKPEIAFFCNCSGRRPLVKDLEKKDVENLKKKFPTLNFFGFYSFGEVGSTKTMAALLHSQTVTALTIFNDLLTK